MSKLALGMIETVGLAAAIEAADVAVKSANIKLIGYEFAKGNGMTTVKIEGTVGAVKAAIDAAVASAGKVNEVWGKSVIPRPSDGLEVLIYNNETVGLERNQEKKEENINIQKEPKDLIEDEKTDDEIKNIEDEEQIEEDQEDISIYEEDDREQEVEGCNLCKDPKCPRRKGDLRKMCIHYDELKEEGRFYK